LLVAEATVREIGQVSLVKALELTALRGRLGAGSPPGLVAIGATSVASPLPLPPRSRCTVRARAVNAEASV